MRLLMRYTTHTITTSILMHAHECDALRIYLWDALPMAHVTNETRSDKHEWKIYETHYAYCHDKYLNAHIWMRRNNAIHCNETHYRWRTLRMKHTTNETHYEWNTLRMKTHYEWNTLRMKTHYEWNTLRMKHTTNETHYDTLRMRILMRRTILCRDKYLNAHISMKHTSDETHYQWRTLRLKHTTTYYECEYLWAALYLLSREVSWCEHMNETMKYHSNETPCHIQRWLRLVGSLKT